MHSRFYWARVAPHLQLAVRYLKDHRKRAAMDRESLWQRIPCRVRPAPVGTGAI